jgi:hypothetical protein
VLPKLTWTGLIIVLQANNRLAIFSFFAPSSFGISLLREAALGHHEQHDVEAHGVAARGRGHVTAGLAGTARLHWNP